MAGVKLFYVLSWYSDGGRPELKFFTGDEAVVAASYAAQEASNGKKVEVGFAQPDDRDAV
jgi:hypothetical protein